MTAPQSVTRVIAILEALCARAEPVSLAELSRTLAAPKSSLAALLAGLREAELVAAEGAAWRLAPGAFGLGSALMEARRRLQSSDIVRQAMARLAGLSRETVLFAVADAGGETLTYVDVIESREAVRFAVQPGDRRPLYCTSSGRILLASGPAERVERYLRQLRPEKLSERTVVDKRELARLIAAAREQAVAQTVDQAGEGVTGTSAVVRDSAGAVLGALTVAAPRSRAGSSLDALLALVQDEAAAASRALGYRGQAGINPLR